MILLDIAVFATADSNWDLALDPYIEAANYHLHSYGMQLHVYPPRPKAPIQLPQTGAMFDPPPDGNSKAMRPGDLRSACALALPQGHGIPVIFSKFHSSSAAGQCIFTDDTAANRGVRWLNYVLIKENNLNSDRGCLLHELIHAAEYSSPDHFPMNRVGDRWEHDLVDQHSIMRPTPMKDVPVTMYERHAMALRRTYFARYV